VEVADRCPNLPAVPETRDLLAEGGRGLLLVAAATDRWGGMPHLDGRGKTVWFECLLDAADGPTEKPDRRRS
jgi:hypothetical protein